MSGGGSQGREKFHTLESFAASNFRSVSQATVNSARQRSLLSSAGARADTQSLWKHQRDPIRFPLLKSLIQKEELAQEAVMIFTAILKYMSDLPSRAIRTSNELTDQIFEGPLKHDILRDEVYCQIMKQLTGNRNSHSEQRGWDLLWLATGLFPCSKNLMKDLTLFQKTHKVSCGLPSQTSHLTSLIDAIRIQSLLTASTDWRGQSSRDRENCRLTRWRWRPSSTKLQKYFTRFTSRTTRSR